MGGHGAPGAKTCSKIEKEHKNTDTRCSQSSGICFARGTNDNITKKNEKTNNKRRNNNKEQTKQKQNKTKQQ